MDRERLLGHLNRCHSAQQLPLVVGAPLEPLPPPLCPPSAGSSPPAPSQRKVSLHKQRKDSLGLVNPRPSPTVACPLAGSLPVYATVLHAGKLQYSCSQSLTASLTRTGIRWMQAEMKGVAHAASNGGFNGFGNTGGFGSSNTGGFGFGGGSKRTVFGSGTSTNSGGGNGISSATGPKVDVFGASAPPSSAIPLPSTVLPGTILIYISTVQRLN